MKKSILPLIPILCLLLMLLNPALSLEGARAGLLLWFNVVLPTLLPFMLCSSLIVSWGGVPVLTRPFAPLFGLLKLSPAGSYTFMAGILCGYPMGAKTAADFVRRGEITAAEGKRLLAAAAFPSPMFLAGYVRALLPGTVPFACAALALYLPALILAALSLAVYGAPGERRIRQKTEKSPSALPLASPSPAFDDSLMGALETMVKIGGYLMLFSILVLFAKHFLPKAFTLRPVLLGLIEMTTGIDEISRSMSGVPAAAAMVAASAFGGLSGAAQTGTVIKNAGLSIRHYVIWKLLHAILSSLVLILLLCR